MPNHCHLLQLLKKGLEMAISMQRNLSREKIEAILYRLAAQEKQNTPSVDRVFNDLLKH